MKVPYFDLQRQYITIKNELERKYSSLRSTQYSLGPEVQLFEKNFSNFMVNYCTGVNTGPALSFSFTGLWNRCRR